MEASMLALLDTLQTDEERARPKSSATKTRGRKQGKSAGKTKTKITAKSVGKLHHHHDGNDFVQKATSQLQHGRASTAKARKRRDKRQEKRERDFAQMMLINPQQLAIMMGAMGGASMVRKGGRAKDASTSSGKRLAKPGDGPGLPGGPGSPGANGAERKEVGAARNGKPGIPGADTPKDLAEKQANVDKLASKADLLEVKLIKHTRAIESVRKQMVEEKRKRREMGGVKAYRMIQNQKAKQQQILENRLNKLNMRSSELEARNSDVVRAINARRLERQTFERSYKKLKRAFRAKQREMAVMLAQSNVAYEGRQEALKQLQDATDRAQLEEETFAREYAELGSVVQEQAQIKSYVQQTAIKRKEKQLAERIAAGNLDAEEEAMLKSKLSTLSRELKKQVENISVSNESIQSYEEAFEKLYASTGIRDMNAIVEQFVRNEDSNFALYNHVQQITRDIERDEDQLRRINGEMEKYKKELSQNEGHRERIVADLEQRLERYLAQISSLSEQIVDNEQSLEAICQATENLFFRIGCPEMRGLEQFRAPEIVGVSMESTTSLVPRDANSVAAARLSMSSPTRSRSIARKVNHTSTSSSAGSPPLGPGSRTSSVSSFKFPLSPSAPEAGSDQSRHSTTQSELSTPAGAGAAAVVATKAAKKRLNGLQQEDGDTALILRLGNRVTEANIMVYLGTIEQRTTEIMQLYRKFCIKAQPTFKGAERLSISGVVVPALPRSTLKLDVQVPSCKRVKNRQDRQVHMGEVGSRSILDRATSVDEDDDDDDDIDDERPFSSEQLREMTVRENLPVEPAF
ncbi:Coiled-coil domain-containing protein 63 [Hondaea fermentalgiana]|uniref:Coiled-coil domain-containing protein 63 n=1 Tax=Hondaea fermentalgiana TaxID=2315210 RepID=A0A2R5GHN5_9STRA|nr:Coiled-coil domain-containing protein 63 [Hondaea fermentalgiana]|eukprot:GBG30407.1 Coiled-coil domain-containing protein 63 [Hondaea fermentalgiana]